VDRGEAAKANANTEAAKADEAKEDQERSKPKGRKRDHGDKLG